MDNITLIGTQKGQPFLVILSPQKPEAMRVIRLPENISIEGIRLYEQNKNVFIKTQNALLFLYQGSDEIYWLVDGRILLVGSGFCLYEKDGKIWEAVWNFHA